MGLAGRGRGSRIPVARAYIWRARVESPLRVVNIAGPSGPNQGLAALPALHGLHGRVERAEARVPERRVVASAEVAVDGWQSRGGLADDGRREPRRLQGIDEPKRLLRP